MPLQEEINFIPNYNFALPMRAIFSGSSQSGKTYLIGKILENQERLFGEHFTSVKYYFPSYLDEAPVNFHTTIETPISYERGMPNKSSILSIPEGSLLIIDDQFDAIIKSELLSQFFKVISGKRKLSIIAVTQNYFQQGRFSRDIRNSSNFVALFRNCGDSTLNTRVAKCFGLKRAYEQAEKDCFSTEIYPYFLLIKHKGRNCQHIDFIQKFWQQFELCTTSMV